MGRRTNLGRTNTLLKSWRWTTTMNYEIRYFPSLVISKLPFSKFDKILNWAACSLNFWSDVFDIYPITFDTYWYANFLSYLFAVWGWNFVFCIFAYIKYDFFLFPLFLFVFFFHFNFHLFLFLFSLQCILCVYYHFVVAIAVDL